MKIRFILIIVLAIIGFIDSDVYSDDEDLRARGACHMIEYYVNSLVNYTNTKCLAGAGEQKGTIGLILISEKPIFTMEAEKKCWLIVVVGAIGRTMADNPNLKIDTIVVCDTNMLAKGKAFSFPGILAKNLQQKLYNDEINLEQLYKQLIISLKEYSIPAQ